MDVATVNPMVTTTNTIVMLVEARVSQWIFLLKFHPSSVKINQRLAKAAEIKYKPRKIPPVKLTATD
jgi:hypothetical protein